MTGPTAPELAMVIQLVQEVRAKTVNVGYGRDLHSLECATAFIAAWNRCDGEIGEVVSWPDTAASWLKFACKLTAGPPDAWVIADTPLGWQGIGRRLAAMGSWRPHHAVAYAGLADARLPDLVGVDTTDGLAGAQEDGTSWLFAGGVLIDQSRAAGVRHRR